jgi:hypothetical protein
MVTQLSGTGASTTKPLYQQVFTESRGSGSSYTYSSVPIGNPSSSRRLLIQFVATFLPSGTLNYNCTVNGVAATLLAAQLPNGFAITSEFSSYVNRDFYFVSQPIPDGTTATIVVTTGVSNGFMGVNVIRAENMQSITQIAGRSSATGSVTLSFRSQSACFFQSGSTGNNSSATTISNANRRINSAYGCFYNKVYVYVNDTETQLSVTFTYYAGGTVNYIVFF